MVVIIGCASFWLFGFVNHALHFEETDNAYIAGHLHQVSSRIEGTVQEVLVEDNQMVKAGEPLLRLDPLELQIAVEKARANLDHAHATEAQARAAVSQAKAQAIQAQAEIRQSEAKVAQAAAQLQVAELNKGRNVRLYSSDSRAVAKADVDTTSGLSDSAQGGLDGAKASLDAARAGLTAAEAGEESATAQATAAQASGEASQVTVRDAERLLSYTTVVAPVAGRVGAKSVETGNRLQPGQAVLSLAEEEVWVFANFKETQLARMKPGQPVQITIDALPGHKFSGRVESIAPASGAQYALLPPDNATGNFTKVVQRVTVKIVFDPDSIRDFRDRIRPGLSTIVNVSVR
jgi:membrane fusion protein (multidrug efflux system)